LKPAQNPASKTKKTWKRQDSRGSTG